MGIATIFKRYRSKSEADNLPKVPLSKSKGTVLSLNYGTPSRTVLQLGKVDALSHCPSGKIMFSNRTK